MTTDAQIGALIGVTLVIRLTRRLSRREEPLRGSFSAGISMAPVGAAGADDEDGGAVGEVAAGGELVHEGAVELRQPLEVELLE